MNVVLATLYVALHLFLFPVYRCDAFEVNLGHLDYSELNTTTILDNTKNSNSQQCPCFYMVWDNSNYDELKTKNNMNISVITTYETKCSGSDCLSYLFSLYGKVIYYRYIRQNVYNLNNYQSISDCQYYIGFSEACNYGNCYTITSCTSEGLLSASIRRQKIYWNGQYYENALRVQLWYRANVNCDLTCPNPTISEVTKTYLMYVLPEAKPIQNQVFKSSQGITINTNTTKTRQQNEKVIMQYEK